jgi:hypothetical protein
MSQIASIEKIMNRAGQYRPMRSQLEALEIVMRKTFAGVDSAIF